MDVVMAFVRFDRDKTLMNCLGELRAYVRALFQKEKLDRELEDELRFHVEMEAQARIAKGMTPTQAKEAAFPQCRASCRSRNPTSPAFHTTGMPAKTRAAWSDDTARPIRKGGMMSCFAARFFARHAA